MGQSTETLSKLQATYEHFFPSNVTLSTVKEQYNQLVASGNVVRNDNLEQALSATLDSIDMVMNTITKLQQYIILTVPKMEDGGNFGVGIQLDALKSQNDILDKITKCVDELMKYTSSRADAIEKIKLPSSNTSKTNTNSSSESTTSGSTDEKEKDGNKKSQSVVNEEKAIQTVVTLSPIEVSMRLSSIVAVDITYYIKAKTSFHSVLIGYMSIVDYMDKNQLKIEKPKGEGGSRGGQMY